MDEVVLGWVGAGALLVVAALLWVARPKLARDANRLEATRDGDAYVLKYGNGWRVPCVVFAVLMVGRLADAATHPETRWDEWAVPAAGLVLLLLSMSDVFSSYRITDDGIERRTPWRTQRIIHWSAIRRIGWSTFLQAWMLESAAGKLYVSRYLAGSGTFARSALEHVARARMDSSAAERLEEFALRASR